MKQTPSNPLRQQLALRQEPGPHPDANLLTAFAEDALLPRERAQVLDHLAACSSCREVLHTATSASAPLPAQPASEARPARSPLRVWLGGFALAFCLIVLVGSVVLFEHVLRTQVSRSQVSLNRPAPVAALPPSPAPAEAPASHHSGTAPAHTSRPGSSQRSRTSALRSLESDAVPSTTQSVTVVPEQPQISTATPSSSGFIAGSASANANTSAAPQNTFVTPERSAAPAHPPGTAAGRAPAFAESRSESRSFAPQRAAAAFKARASSLQHWRLSDAGQIEQRTSAGAWQPIAVGTGVKFRVLSVSGVEVWAGGDHLALFHSTDNGVTWSKVHLPATADSTRAITEIRVDSSQKIAVQSDDGIVWTTTDAGQTWQ